MLTANNTIRFLGFLSIFILMPTSRVVASDKDSTYIADFDRKYSFQLNLGTKNVSLSEKINDSKELTYLPNTPVSIGASISWKKSLLSLSFLQINLLRDNNKVDTKSMDFQYSYHARKYMFDFYAQKYKGFYEEETNVARPDIDIIRFGGLGQYFFNNKKFSYQSSFGYSERQLKSAGTFQIGLGANYNRIKADQFLLMGNRIENLQFAPTAGYIYTWIFKKRYFLTGSMTVGGNLTVDLRGEENVNVSPLIVPKIVFGYHADDWSLAMTGVSHGAYMMLTDTKEAMLRTNKFEISFVRRFDFKSKITDKVSNLLTR